MGLLEAPKGGDTKQLGAGVPTKGSKDDDISSASTAHLGGLTAEDLKELEDLDLSELDTKEAKKA